MKRRPRYFAMAAALFLAVAILIVLAHLRSPVNLPVDEPPEVTLKRQDKQNNACYVLWEAVKMLPEEPRPHDGRYTPESGAAGDILNVNLPDDDPLLADYIRQSRPALDHALNALEKPYFLHPTDPAADPASRVMAEEIWRLVALCQVQAKLHECSQDPREDACVFLHNTARITKLYAGNARFPSIPEAARVIRKACPEHQRRIAQWLAEYRTAWQPPMQSLEEFLRSLYLCPQHPKAQGRALPFRLVAGLQLDLTKKRVRQHEQELRQAACMTYLQYDQYRKEDPGFMEFDMMGMTPGYIPSNSSFFAGMDGLSTVLALEAYQQDQGEYPQTLDALVPKYLATLHQNPYNGQGYEYKRIDKEYALYCVGGRRAGDKWQPRQYFLILCAKRPPEGLLERLRPQQKMTRGKSKRSARRNVAVVVLFFAGVAVLIALARLRTPPQFPTGESPDVAQKRLDTKNNACYTLAQAVNMLPEPPPPLQIKDEDGWEHPYKAEEDSLGRMLQVDRPDDDPLLHQYVEQSRPALAHARRALEKPWFLHSIGPVDYKGQRALRDERESLERLTAVYFALARLQPCSNDPATDCCAVLHDVLNLARLMAADWIYTFPAHAADAAAVIRKASPEHQAATADLLHALRDEWKPPLNEIDRQVRQCYAMALVEEGEKEPWPVRVIWKMRIEQLKRQMLAQEPYYRAAAVMTYNQHTRYLSEHPECKNMSLAADRLAWICGHNSAFFASVDGLLTVLALEAWRRDNGSYPDTLEPLVPRYLPALPENPFTPRPFVYSRIPEEHGGYELSCYAGEAGRWWNPSENFVIVGGRHD